MGEIKVALESIDNTWGEKVILKCYIDCKKFLTKENSIRAHWRKSLQHLTCNLSKITL